MNKNENFWLTSSIACALAGLAVAIVKNSRKNVMSKIKTSNRNHKNQKSKTQLLDKFCKSSSYDKIVVDNLDINSKNIEPITDHFEDSSYSEEESLKNQQKIVKIGCKKNFQCSYCDQKFKREIHLRRHELNHQNRKCSYCGRFFKEPIRLRNHLRTHTGEKPFQCSQCPAVFALKSNLKTHFIYKHTDDRPFKCRYPDCEKFFKTEQLRKHHEKRHNQNAELQCEICGMEFNVRAKLRMHHRKKHMDYSQRPHHCRFCDKKFVEKDQYREHERTHTGEKPLKCNQCSKSFAKKSSLREHKKLHSGEKKHVCKICGKAFAQSAGYWNHMRNHP